MRVLDRIRDGDEQRQPLAHAELLLVAVIGDRYALDVLHHEVRSPGRRGPAVEHVRDCRVIEHREGLPLGLEPGDHGLRVHAELDDLERHAPLHGCGLLGEVDRPHPALSDPLEDAVAADLVRHLAVEFGGEPLLQVRIASG